MKFAERLNNKKLLFLIIIYTMLKVISGQQLTKQQINPSKIIKVK